MKAKLFFCIMAAMMCSTFSSCSGLSNQTEKDLTSENTTTEVPKPVQKQIKSLTANKYISNYRVGERIDHSNVKISAIYDDGSIEDVTKDCTFDPMQGTELTLTGEKVITAKHVASGLTCDYRISISDNVIISIDVSGTTKDFYDGDKFTYDGIKVNAILFDGTTVDVTNGCSFNIANGEVLEDIGNKEISIIHNPSGKVYTYYITVTALNIESISAVNYKETYYAEDYFDNSTTVIAGHLANGDIKDVTSKCTFTTANTDLFNDPLSYVGPIAISVKYYENFINLTTSFSITVKPRTLDTIEIKSKPSKTVFGVGQKFSCNDLVLNTKYTDAPDKEISSGFTYEGYDTLHEFTDAEKGLHTVTVKYLFRGVTKSTTYQIRVVINHKISLYTYLINNNNQAGHDSLTAWPNIYTYDERVYFTFKNTNIKNPTTANVTLAMYPEAKINTGQKTDIGYYSGPIQMIDGIYYTIVVEITEVNKFYNEDYFLRDEGSTIDERWGGTDLMLIGTIL